jgi:hypothetical protein
VSLALVPLAAAAGLLVGAIAHETTHAVLAVVLGELVGVGWAGGLAGGPVVDFRAPTRLRSEVVRKGPVVLGVVAAASVVVGFGGVTLGWLFEVGVAVGLLQASPQDLFVSRARATAGE